VKQKKIFNYFLWRGFESHLTSLCVCHCSLCLVLLRTFIIVIVANTSITANTTVLLVHLFNWPFVLLLIQLGLPNLES